MKYKIIGFKFSAAIFLTDEVCVTDSLDKVLFQQSRRQFILQTITSMQPKSFQDVTYLKMMPKV